jgi:hypothetical protein
MTTTSIASKIAIAHEASLQERERGRLELEESLRKSNAALAAEAVQLRERLAELEAESRDFKALGKRCEEAEQHLREVEQQRDAAQAKLDACYDGTALLDAEIAKSELEQQLAEAKADHALKERLWRERDERVMAELAEANAMRSKMTDACEQALKREAEYRQELAEANARLAEWSDFDNADSAKRQIAAAYQSRDSWKARALRYEQVTAEVLSRTPTYGGKTLQRCLDTDPMSETTERSARFNLALHVEEILGDLRSIAATPPQDREPEGERLTGLSLDEAKAAVERGLCVETFYPDDPDFKGCTRAIRDGELRVWDPRYPSCGWGKMGIPGHWPDRASFRIVPDPSKPTPTPAAEQQEGGGNV